MIKSGQIYRHYKGNVYRVIGTAKHTESLEDLVIYCKENNHEEIWARPTVMFEEKLADGRKRFELIGE